MPHRGQGNNGVKSKLGQDNGCKKCSYIYRQNGLVGEFLISVENYWYKNGEHKQTHELGTEVIGIIAVIIAVEKRPEESGGDGYLDMFPGGFVDRCK